MIQKTTNTKEDKKKDNAKLQGSVSSVFIDIMSSNVYFHTFRIMVSRQQACSSLLFLGQSKDSTNQWNQWNKVKIFDYFLTSSSEVTLTLPMTFDFIFADTAAHQNRISREEAANCIRKVLRRKVTVSSFRQAVSGVFAAGGVNATRYLARKMSKAWKSRTSASWVETLSCRKYGRTSQQIHFSVESSKN